MDATTPAEAPAHGPAPAASNDARKVAMSDDATAAPPAADGANSDHAAAAEAAQAAALAAVVEMSAGLLSDEAAEVSEAMRGLVEQLCDANRKDMRLGRDGAALDLVGSRLLPHFDRACELGESAPLLSVFAVVGALYRHLVSDCDLSLRLSSVFDQLLALSDAQLAETGVALAMARLLTDIVSEPRVRPWCVARAK